MAKTNAQAQADLVKRRNDAGLYAVRGIWAHLDLHSRIKAYARRLVKAREKK